MAAPDASAGAALGGAALITALGGVMGPVAAEWAAVAFFAFLGSLARTADLETKSFASVWWSMVKGIALSLVFTAGVAKFASSTVGLPPVELLCPIAGLIAWQQSELIQLARSWWAQRKGTAP